ncbi:hypothetical protein HK103_002702 [Boothiomyces macroporosus]|uniref:RRM domain-containing protein n=1 Tax=Boothiomyces macroporosus TaxID=261099 RepID=A0AAD5Y8N7_9FUNG|nr:hypothetical protein HK103_002702 [Boothiomyces macroporosus]
MGKPQNQNKADKQDQTEPTKISRNSELKARAEKKISKKLEKQKAKQKELLKELEDPNAEISKRLYIGGLVDISEQELYQKLSIFGNISNTDYKNDYAFITIKSNAANYKKLLKLNGTKWKKSNLKIQEAKQHYLIKLKREQSEPEVIKKRNTKKNMVQFQPLNLKKGWIRINGRLVAKLKQRLPNGRQTQPGMKNTFTKFDLEPIDKLEINFETTDLSKETHQRLEKQRLLAGNFTEQEQQLARQCFLDYKTEMERKEKERMELNLSKKKYELLLKERLERQNEKVLLDSVVQKIMNNESMNVVEFDEDVSLEEDEEKIVVDQSLKSKLDLFDSDSE